MCINTNTMSTLFPENIISFSLLRKVILPSLIPVKTIDGCQPPANEYNSTCCCKIACCMKRCKGRHPPIDCLARVNSKWVWNSNSDIWTAQKSSGMGYYSYKISLMFLISKTHFMLNINTQFYVRLPPHFS